MGLLRRVKMTLIRSMRKHKQCGRLRRLCWSNFEIVLLRLGRKLRGGILFGVGVGGVQGDDKSYKSKGYVNVICCIT